LLKNSVRFETPSFRADSARLLEKRGDHANSRKNGERQLMGKCQDLPAPQLIPHDHLAGRIHAVHLKDRLGDIETDCRNPTA
jgi:hypothetical protein